ncbi:MAG: AAA family ATPase [Ruegeria sp.]
MTASGSSPQALADRIAEAVAGLAANAARQLIAVAGPPGAGKSTVAGLARRALQDRGVPAGLLSMDGFHYDNRILAERDLQPCKGAPETFDLSGFHATLRRLRVEDEVAVPEFDRTLDKSIAACSLVTADQRVVIVEGNYLLLNEPGWTELSGLWALTVFLDVPLPTLEARLLDRWTGLGLPPEVAERRAFANDIPNARRVVQNSSPADLVLR